MPNDLMPMINILLSQVLFHLSVIPSTKSSLVLLIYFRTQQVCTRMSFTTQSTTLAGAAKLNVTQFHTRHTLLICMKTVSLNTCLTCSLVRVIFPKYGKPDQLYEKIQVFSYFLYLLLSVSGFSVIVSGYATWSDSLGELRV